MIENKELCESNSVNDMSSENNTNDSNTNDDNIKHVKLNNNSDNISDNSGDNNSDNISDNADYLYDSDEDNSSSINTEDEKDYFGDSSEISSECSEVAWADSDDDNEIREDYKDSATWLNSTGLAKKLERKTKKIQFKLTNKIFNVKSKIKIFKIIKSENNLIEKCTNLNKNNDSNIKNYDIQFSKIAIDSFNIVYLINTFEDFKSYKIDYFRISGIVFFNKRVLLYSENCSYIKELTYTGEVVDINKRTGNIKKMVEKDNDLYIAADKLYLLNKNMNIKNTFNLAFMDICVSNKNILCLKSDGDIYVFDRKLNFIKKCSIPGKFQFKGIFSINNRFFIKYETGFYVLNSDFALEKIFDNTKSEPTCITKNNDFVVYGSNDQNSLRIIKDGLISYDRFPFSKVKISPIGAMDFDGDELYFCHSRYISKLLLKYE